MESKVDAKASAPAPSVTTEDKHELTKGGIAQVIATIAKQQPENCIPLTLQAIELHEDRIAAPPALIML